MPVTIFQYDFGIATGLTFTFEGEAEEAFDRLLLPVFVPPIRGAFGSEFRTELRVSLARGATGDVPIYGLLDERIYGEDAVWELDDDSRGARTSCGSSAIPRENLGTEIPIVRTSAFRTTRFALLGVRHDRDFRMRGGLKARPHAIRASRDLSRSGRRCGWRWRAGGCGAPARAPRSAARGRSARA